MTVANLDVREPDIYVEHGDHSYFRDVVLAGNPVQPGGPGALDRLRRHHEHETTRRTKADLAAYRALAALGIETRAGDVQSRALSTSSTSLNWTPPLYLVDRFVSINRAAAALRSVLPSAALPDGTMEIHVPRINSVGGVLPESGGQENQTAPGGDMYSPNAGLPTDQIVSPVRTFVSTAGLSQQLFDRSNMDAVIVSDLAKDYAYRLESELVNGSGLGGHLTGLLSVGNAATVTWTAATPAAKDFVTQCGALAAAVGNGRLRAPSHLVMRIARYYWMAGQPDGSTNEPVMRPGTGIVPANPDQGDCGGPVAGVPVLLSGVIPTNLGAGSNQDTVIAIRSDDHVVLEADPVFTAMPETFGSQLTVTFQARVYATALLNRRPAGVALLQGTGLVVPAGY